MFDNNDYYDGYNFGENGNIKLVSQLWAVRGNSSTFTKEEIKDIISDSIKEEGDKIMVNGKEIGVDNFVRKGELETANNATKLKLDMGEKDKSVEIDLTYLDSQAISENTIAEMFK